MREHTAQRDATDVKNTSNFDQTCIFRTDAGAVSVGINLDQNFKGIAATRLCFDDGLRDLNRVDENGETAPLPSQLSGTVEFVRRDADRIENVVVSCSKELFRFTQSRDGDAVGTSGALPVGNGDAFCRFHVRPETDAKVIHPVLHAGDVPLHARRVDDGGGRFDILKKCHVQSRYSPLARSTGTSCSSPRAISALTAPGSRFAPCGSSTPTAVICRATSGSAMAARSASFSF